MDPLLNVLYTSDMYDLVENNLIGYGDDSTFGWIENLRVEFFRKNKTCNSAGNMGWTYIFCVLKLYLLKVISDAPTSLIVCIFPQICKIVLSINFF